jgi:Zn-dependent protease
MGIKIDFHLSTLLIVAIIGYVAADFYYSISGSAIVWELVVVGMISGISIVISILLHELMHSFIAKRAGLKISEIELNIFGGMSKITEEPKTPNSEMKISAAGPLTSILIGIVSFGLIYLPISWSLIAFSIIYYLGWTNIILGIFNAIPAFPMDGGRVLRGFLWKRRGNILSATQTSAKIGKYIAFGLMGFGFIELVFISFFSGFWFIIIGSFLVQESNQALRQVMLEIRLSHFRASEIENKLNFSIPSDVTIHQAIKEYFIKSRKRYYPIRDGDKIVGILPHWRILDVPFDQRDVLSVKAIMEPIEKFPTIEERDSAKDALNKLLTQTEKPHLLIVRNSRNDEIVGFISETEINSALKLAAIMTES